MSVRDNYILHLNRPYELLYKGYNKLRKRSVKKAQKLKLQIEEVDNARSLIDLFKKNKGTVLNREEREYELLNQLILKGREQQKIEILRIVSNNKNLLGGVVFFKNKNRIIYLFSAVSKEGKESNTITFINDYIIRKYSDTNMILDFEGSMVPNIAMFFRSFGAIQENYYLYRQRFLF